MSEYLSLKISVIRKKRLHAIAHVINSPTLKRALSEISSLVFFLMIWKIMSINAGPEQNADAINRGARTAAFQNGLDGTPR